MRDPVHAYVLATCTLLPEDPLKKNQVTEPKAELNWESNTLIFSLFFLTFVFLTETRSDYRIPAEKGLLSFLRSVIL